MGFREARKLTSVDQAVWAAEQAPASAKPEQHRLPMRVVHVITALGAGGAERMLTRVVTTASPLSNDIEHVVISLSDEGVYGEQLKAAGARLHCLHMDRSRPSPLAANRLRQALNEIRPDAVMTWLYHADMLTTLAASFSEVSTKSIVWNLRCADVQVTRENAKFRWLLFALKHLSKRVGAIAHNSEAGKLHHKELGYKPPKWVYLPNGFNLDGWFQDENDRREVRQSLDIDDDTVLIGMVARADPLKDHPTFLRAAKTAISKRQNLHFVLIGSGTDELEIPSELVGKITLMGHRRDVPKLMRALDIHVLSSVSEGFPNVIGEAMATSVPCISTDVGDAGELIGDSGTIVPTSDCDALASAMVDLSSEPENIRRERGQRARRRIEQHYDIQGVVALYQDLWRELAS